MNYKSLIEAVKNGSASNVRESLRQGANPNEKDSQNRTGLHWAAQLGSLGIVRCLIEHEAQVNVSDNLGFTPLVVAAGEGHDLIVRELLDAGASAKIRVRSNENGNALHLACSWNRNTVARTLVRLSDVDINEKDDAGKTALAYARESGNGELIEYLLAHKALDE